MKKERNLKLEVNKVSVSKLNMIVAGDGTVSISEFTITCDTNVNGHCYTYINATGSRDRC